MNAEVEAIKLITLHAWDTTAATTCVVCFPASKRGDSMGLCCGTLFPTMRWTEHLFRGRTCSFQSLWSNLNFREREREREREYDTCCFTIIIPIPNIFAINLFPHLSSS